MCDTHVPKEINKLRIFITHPKKCKNDVKMRRHVSVFLIKGNGLGARSLGRQTAVGVASPWRVTVGVDAK
jgi:hypothetical protein